MSGSNTICIDAGASETRIYMRGRGIILREPSVAAVADGSDKIIFGSEAVKNVTRSPGGRRLIYPLAKGLNGANGFTKEASAMLNEYITKACGKRLFRPDALICVPGGLSDVEEKKIASAFSSLPLKRIFLTDSGYAAARGLGCDVFLPKSHMVINIGASHTDISLVSMGSSVISVSYPLGGYALNSAAAYYISNKYSVNINTSDAERIKLAAGTMYEGERRNASVSGLRRNEKLVITSDELAELFVEQFAPLTAFAAKTVDSIPTEHLSDIVSEGIFLTGGTSLLSGMAEIMHQVCGIRINLSQTPLLDTINGGGMLLDCLGGLNKDILSISKPRKDSNVF